MLFSFSSQKVFLVFKELIRKKRNEAEEEKDKERFIDEDDNDEQEEDKIKVDTMREKLHLSPDIVFDCAIVDTERKFPVIFVDGMVDAQMVDDFILKPLIQETLLKGELTEKDVMDLVMSGTVYHCQRRLREKLSDCYTDLFGGSAVLVFEKEEKAVTFDIKGFEKRAISEPTNENVLKGSKESFIEVLRVNTALIRRRLATSDLVIEQLELGRRTHTAVSVVYIEGVANKSIVEEVKKRLNQIDIDGIYSMGVIENYLIDNKISIFPQILYTEKPDKFCAGILEGRVGVLIDGFPTALFLPVDLNSLMQAPEDYTKSYILSSSFRILRYTSGLISLLFPAFYVSVTTFHHEMIPTKLATAIIQSKEGVPFPSYFEVILMLLAFEVLLEAGLRLPKSIGQAVSIVGALVVGEAAITAKILSPGVVIIIAASGITGFIIPSQDFSNTIRVLRLILVACAVTSGLYGVSIGAAVTLYHLCNLEVLGVPYLSPFVSMDGRNILSDTLISAPWGKMKKRPENISPEDTVRQR